jgi:tRNA nucleotidyltransferase (CCA-adding enzyme)
MEDPLRILRSARFAAWFGFSIDPYFVGKARQLAVSIFDVYVERWVQELDKLFTSNHPEVGVEALSRMGMLERMFPEIDFNQWNAATTDDPDAAWKNVLFNGDVNPKTRKFVNAGICARFKFSNERTDFILDKHK